MNDVEVNRPQTKQGNERQLCIGFLFKYAKMFLGILWDFDIP